MDIVFLNGFHQSEVPLLDQVQKRDTAPHEPFGNTYHQPCVGFDDMLARKDPILDKGFQSLPFQDPFPTHRAQ